ncbi:hypothetical protein N9150_00160 [Akkermansiaceae bacterium]|nr:hypothetical protein [Akkermansiaceae bacterium]
MNDQAAWYVLRTQLKREKLAAANLRRLDGVEVFLPRLKYQKNDAARPGVVDRTFVSWLFIGAFFTG